MLYRINLKPILIGLGLALAIPMGAPANSAPESSTNGIYGGYLGSSAWFTEMRRSVTRSASGHQQWRDAIERGLKDGTLAEIMLEIRFPHGNPFPKGEPPDLRVIGPKGDIGAYPFRYKVSNQSAIYYLILQKGQTYTIQFVYYFGQSEDIARLHVRLGGQARRIATMNYIPPSHNKATPHTRPTGSPPSPTTDSSSRGPSIGPGYVRPGTQPSTTPDKNRKDERGQQELSPSERPSGAGSGYVSPSVGPGYTRPGSR
jgi:hypothetical protein